MAAPCYITWNASTTALTSPMSGTATSGTSGTVKTILQIKPGSQKIRIIEWGYRFTTAPAAPVQMELVETGTVFATVTAGSVATYNDTTGVASLAVTGTAATGFNASAEGTITGNEWFNGVAFGVEADTGAGTLTVNSFTVDTTPYAVPSGPTLRITGAR